jgi:hypothetical protein
MVTDAPQLGALLDGPNPFIAVSVLGKTLLGHGEASLEELTGQRRKQTSLRSTIEHGRPLMYLIIQLPTAS